MTPSTYYRELILEHSKCTTHVGPLPSATGSATMHNPLCGDTITMRVQLDENGVLVAARYEVQGCAIAKAVASLLVDRVTGQSVERLRSWVRRARPASQLSDPLDFPELTGIAALPARERCATLPWESLGAAIENSAALEKSSAIENGTADGEPPATSSD